MDPGALRALLDVVPERVKTLEVDGTRLRVEFHPPAPPAPLPQATEEYPGLAELGLRLPAGVK